MPKPPILHKKEQNQENIIDNNKDNKNIDKNQMKKKLILKKIKLIARSIIHF